MIQLLIDWVQINYIELIAATLGVATVWLTTRQNIWCWPIGLVNVIIYIYVYFISKLYADFGLQIFYLFLTIYGWYNWLFGGNNHHKLEKVIHVSLKIFLFSLLIGLSCQTTLGYILYKYTDAALPFLDSIVSIWGIIATYWLAKKYLENWIVWIVIDSISVGICIYKDLYPTSAQYFIFIMLAIVGYFQWKKNIQ